jgi:NarL family two-component system response regulator LiaR
MTKMNDDSRKVPPKNIRVVLVDDHSQIHFAISTMLSVHDDIELVGQGSNGLEAIRLCRQLNPDVILLDVVMPDMDGIQATQEIHELMPNIKILALSGFHDKTSVQGMLSAGAVGYVLKTATSDDLVSAIHAAYDGQSVMSLEVMQTLLQTSKQSGVVTDTSQVFDARRDFGLTVREVDVLRHLVAGKTNGEIAEEMIVSLSTVKFHVSNILQKLGATTRTEAVSLAVEKRLVASD